MEYNALTHTYSIIARVSCSWL